MYHRIGKEGRKYWGRAGAGILFTDGSSVLLLKRSSGTDNPHTWGLPGGKAEGDETPIMTARREVREETGLDSIPGNRLDDFENRDSHHRWTTFLYRVDAPFNIPRLSDEHEDWAWIDLGDLPKTNLHPRLREQLGGYIKAIRRKIAKTFTEWVVVSDVLREMQNTEAWHADCS